MKWAFGEMSLPERFCSVIGHKLRNTLVISESENFYEVNWAKYCVRCGDIVD